MTSELTPCPKPPRHEGEYVLGQDRNDMNLVAHLYDGTFDDPGNPLCARGWNRSNGEGYSIFRENVGERGVCRICERRADQGQWGVPRRPRKTRWL